MKIIQKTLFVILFFLCYGNVLGQMFGNDIAQITQSPDETKYHILMRDFYSSSDKLTDANQLVEVTNKVYTKKDREYFDGYVQAALGISQMDPKLGLKYIETAIVAYKENHTSYLSTIGFDFTHCLSTILACNYSLGVYNTDNIIQAIETHNDFIAGPDISNNTKCGFYDLLANQYMAKANYIKANLYLSKVKAILESGEPMTITRKIDSKMTKMVNRRLEATYTNNNTLSYYTSMSNYYKANGNSDSSLIYTKNSMEITEKTNKKNEKIINKKLPFGGITLPDSMKLMLKENKIAYNISKQVLGGNALIILDLCKSGKKKEAFAYADNLGNMAYYYHITNQLEESEATYQKAFTLVEELKETKYCKWAYTLYTKTLGIDYLDLQCARKNFAYVLPEFDKQLEADDKILQQNFAYFSDNERKQYFDTYSSALSKYYSLLLSASEKNYNPSLKVKILNKSLQTKGVVMDATAEQKKRFKNVTDPEALNNINKIKAYREKLTAFIQVNGTTENNLLDDSISRYTVMINSLQKNINDKIGVHATIIKNISWNDIQTKLKSDEAYVEVITVSKSDYIYDQSTFVQKYIPQYWAFIIKNTGTADAVFLGEGEVMQNGLMVYQQKMQEQKEDTLSYNLYWQKIANEIVEKKRVFFSSDGVYHLINPLTLMNPLTKKYVLDETELVTLSTWRDLQNKHINNKTKNESVFIGNPNFNMGRKSNNLKIQERPVDMNMAMLSKKRSGYSSLPGTEKEVNAIASYAMEKGINVSVLKGDKANEVNVKNIMSPEILHFATHGGFDTGNNIDSYFRSMLILAGAGDEEPFTVEDYSLFEDGYLTAYEVTQMNLSDTRLVVLSACETGLGDVQSGEGVWGLQRAFQIAGAQSILGSLWPISDDATVDYMKSFYKSYYNGASASTSYQIAMQEARKIYPHPFFWGGFVLKGLE